MRREGNELIWLNSAFWAVYRDSCNYNNVNEIKRNQSLKSNGTILRFNYLKKIIFLLQTYFWVWTQCHSYGKFFPNYGIIIRKFARNLAYSIRVYWTHFWPPTVRKQKNIFEKTLIEVDSSHLYASSGTFCQSEILNFRKISKRNQPHFPSKTHCASKFLPIWTQKVLKEA